MSNSSIANHPPGNVLIMKAQRSLFVTVLAWIFITFSGLATAISVMQNVMIAMMFREISLADQVPQGSPALFAFIASNFQLLAFAFLAVSVFFLVNSIGLLKRKNWARLCIIVMMGLGIISALSSVVVQMLALTVLKSEVDVIEEKITFVYFTGAMNIVFTVVICIIFAWIIKRLLSSAIAAEFRT